MQCQLMIVTNVVVMILVILSCIIHVIHILLSVVGDVEARVGLTQDGLIDLDTR